jgi:hypothetical protein
VFNKTGFSRRRDGNPRLKPFKFCAIQRHR